MVQKLFCERYLSIQIMLEKKGAENNKISKFPATPTYLKLFFFLSFFMNLSLIMKSFAKASKMFMIIISSIELH